MNLNIEKWKEFYLKDIFDIKYGVNLELNACEEVDIKNDDNINFVSRTSSNNGVSSRVNLISTVTPQEAGLISVAGGGSVLSTFYQEEQFYSGRDLYTLKCKENISKEAKFFIITIIEKNKYKYSYGRQANKTLPDIKIVLPVVYNDDGTIFIDRTKRFSKYGYVPDWSFMENYIKTLHYQPLTTGNTKNNLCLDFDKWGTFKVGDVFPKVKVKKYNSIPEEEGDIPFVSSSSVDNGVTSYVNEIPIKGNCITVSTNGDCFDAFYHENYIAVSSDVEVLYSDKMNKYSGIFIATILKYEKYRWSYGRKPKNDKVYDTIIKLPITETGVVDWSFMENYVKRLLYGDKL